MRIHKLDDDDNDNDDGSDYNYDDNHDDSYNNNDDDTYNNDHNNEGIDDVGSAHDWRIIMIINNMMIMMIGIMIVEMTISTTCSTWQLNFAYKSRTWLKSLLTQIKLMLPYTMQLPYASFTGAKK